MSDTPQATITTIRGWRCPSCEHLFKQFPQVFANSDVCPECEVAKVADFEAVT